MWNQLNYGALGVKYGISCHMTQLAYSTGFLLRFQSLSFFYFLLLSMVLCYLFYQGTAETTYDHVCTICRTEGQARHQLETLLGLNFTVPEQYRFQLCQEDYGLSRCTRTSLIHS